MKLNPWRDKEKKLRKLARKQEILVLIWGSGKPKSKGNEDSVKLYDKRIEMKKAVEKSFPCSNVKFSEDLISMGIPKNEQNTLRKEAIHAKIAHIVLMLDIGRGVDLELDHFVLKFSWFRDKVYVFIPKKFCGTEGLVSEVYKFLPPNQIFGFTPSQFDCCQIAKKKSVEIVDVVAMAKLLEFK